MLFNLSLKNIKKSIKDYSIYFFTLVVAVAIFYIFNSMDAQQSMLIINESKHNMIEGLIFLLGYVSVFVSIILGFLIIYSNNFLIKRRKKEIGMYLTLGMSKQRVSFILVLETIMVGIISLAVGLFTGVMLSQGLSMVIAKMFEADMTSFKFVFSSSALYKTLLYFGIIFILVMIFNVISLSRYKLIDLLTANKKNEEVKIRNKFISIISFILSVILLGIGYYLLFDNALLMMDKKTVIMLLCGVLGTLLFFFSLSGFLLAVLQKTKKLYYKDLNMFVLKQINNKVNTKVVSTTVICLMLLLTIGILSGSISMANAFNSGLKENNLTDFTLMSYHEGYYKNGLIPKETDLSIFESNNEFDKFVKEYVRYDIYYDELAIEDLMDEKSLSDLHKKYGDMLAIDSKVPIIKESDYIKIMTIYGLAKDIIDIDDNEYLELSNVSESLIYFKSALKDNQKITVNSKELVPGCNKILEIPLFNYNGSGNDGAIVVSDDVINKLNYAEYRLLGNYVDNNDVETLEKAFSEYLEENGVNSVLLRSKFQMETSSVSIKLILTFVGMYLGIIFAISSVTILAIGELSESSDNKERFRILRQIGADEKKINKALFTQIAITFILPLFVALIHAFFGLREFNNIIQLVGNIDVQSSIWLTTLFMITVYGGYFVLTYICSKNIIKD